MTEKSNINGYLVGNFSQYLNALDFKNHEMSKGRHYLFILCTHQNAYKEIKKNLVLANWDKVWVFYSRILIFFAKIQIPVLSGYAYLLNEYYVYKKALKNAKKIEFSFLAIGNYFYPTYRSFSNQVKKNKIVVLDDGANILNHIENLIKEKDINYLVRSAVGSILFKELKLTYDPSVIYFGVYRKLKFRENDLVIFNRKFNNLNNIELYDSAYIIGQKIYNSGINFERYLETLQEIVKELNIRKVFYIPHRMESKKDINEIKNIFEVFKPGEPIETSIIKQKKSPTKFISFYSSALLNLKLMNIRDVQFYAIKSKELTISFIKKQMIYDYYQSEGINIIEK